LSRRAAGRKGNETMGIEQEIAELEQEIARLSERGEEGYYAVVRYGTSGLGSSYGYAEVVEVVSGQPKPKEDRTTTVSGPHSRQEAEAIAIDWESVCAAYRASQDRR